MKLTRHIAVALIVGMCPALTFAGSGWFHWFGWHKHEQSCATCRARIETEKVEKTCFEVECKQKCIPKITFPWQKRHSGCDECDAGCDNCEGCAPGCGRVITVNTLKKRKYECEQPVCKWEIEAGCCDRCGAAGCCETTTVPDAGDPTEPDVVRFTHPPLAPPVSEGALKHQPR